MTLIPQPGITNHFPSVGLGILVFTNTKLLRFRCHYSILWLFPRMVSNKKLMVGGISEYLHLYGKRIHLKFAVWELGKDIIAEQNRVITAQ